MNRVLVIGAGSIGQRHIKALLEIGVKNIAAFRTNKGTLILDDSLDKKIHCFYDIDEALKWQPTHIIISNPTSLHFKFIRMVVETNAKLFIEKPVVDNYDILVSTGTVYEKLILSEGFAGFNLRFNSVFNEIKGIIAEKKFGNPYSSYLHVGHYLPFWHPYEDYRTGYVARKELGGGALRSLSHEIDLTQHFFGRFNKLFAKVSKLSDLEIDTDDTVDILAQNENCPRSAIHIDLLNPLIRRFGFIHFEKGLLEYDFMEAKLFFTSYESRVKELIYNTSEGYNLQYVRQMKHFIYGSNYSGCTIQEGLEVDKVIKYCELSNEQGVEICLP